MVNESEAREKLMSMLPGYKPNPNHYEIIRKWNSKIYKQHKFEIFDYVESLVDQEIQDQLSQKKLTSNYTKLLDLKDIPFGDKVYTVGNYGTIFFKPEEEDESTI